MNQTGEDSALNTPEITDVTSRFMLSDKTKKHGTS